MKKHIPLFLFPLPACPLQADPPPSSVIAIGIKNKLAGFAGDAGIIEGGAIAAQAYDRKTLGVKPAFWSSKYCKGSAPSNLAVEKDHLHVLMINLKSVSDMDISIPNNLTRQAQIMGDRS